MSLGNTFLFLCTEYTGFGKGKIRSPLLQELSFLCVHLYTPETQQVNSAGPHYSFRLFIFEGGIM